MKKEIRILIWALLLTLTAGFGLAQSDGDQASEAKTDEATEQAQGSGNVYTMEDLQKLAKDGDPTTVYTNESLTDEPPDATAAPAEAFTNRDLSERFGNEGRSAAADEAAPGEGAEEGAEGSVTETEPQEAAPAEPTLSAEERAELIAGIDDELARLEKRLLAIKNPLLAGTEQPTADEAGLDNTERLRRTEEKIDGLNKVLEDLRDD